MICGCSLYALLYDNCDNKQFHKLLIYYIVSYVQLYISNIKSVNHFLFDFRWGADCAGLDGHVYVVGGSDDTSRLHTVERYDVIRDQWSPVPPMSTARNGVGVTAVGGKRSL